MKHDPCSPMFADDADKVHDKYTPIWFTRANFICPIPFYRYRKFTIRNTCLTLLRFLDFLSNYVFLEIEDFTSLRITR